MYQIELQYRKLKCIIDQILVISAVPNLYIDEQSIFKKVSFLEK